MGRKKSDVHRHFTEIKTHNKTVYHCKYCNHNYNVKNASKMLIHLTKLCSKCPYEVKKVFHDNFKKSTTAVKCQATLPSFSASSCSTMPTEVKQNSTDIEDEPASIVFQETNTPTSPTSPTTRPASAAASSIVSPFFDRMNKIQQVSVDSCCYSYYLYTLFLVKMQNSGHSVSVSVF